MSTHHRLVSLLAATAVAVSCTALVTGHAATLQVESAKIDTFAADQPAPTSTTTTAPVGDTQAPQLTTLEMFDTNTNGRVDRVIATFDEALAPYTAGTAPWTLANVPSGGTLDSVAVTGTAATLTIAEGSGNKDTAVGSFTVALAQNAVGIGDAAGNRSSFSATAPADKASPVPASMVIANAGAVGTAAGRPDRGDTVTIVWSERLLASSICSSGFSDTATVTVTGNTGAASIRINNDAHATTSHDTLTASFSCGLRFGSVSLGSSGFVDGTRTFADEPNANRSTAIWAPATATFSLKLGTASGAVNTVPSSVTAVYTPDTLLTDLAGNAATGSVSATAVQF